MNLSRSILALSICGTVLTACGGGPSSSKSQTTPTAPPAGTPIKAQQVDPSVGSNQIAPLLHQMLGTYIGTGKTTDGLKLTPQVRFLSHSQDGRSSLMAFFARGSGVPMVQMNLSYVLSKDSILINFWNSNGDREKVLFKGSLQNGRLSGTLYYPQISATMNLIKESSRDEVAANPAFESVLAQTGSRVSTLSIESGLTHAQEDLAKQIASDLEACQQPLAMIDQCLKSSGVSLAFLQDGSVLMDLGNIYSGSSLNTKQLGFGSAIVLKWIPGTAKVSPLISVYLRRDLQNAYHVGISNEIPLMTLQLESTIQNQGRLH